MEIAIVISVISFLFLIFVPFLDIYALMGAFMELGALILAKCAVNPRPIGRGYKALKNNVFY
jgi:hypothetical protein